MKKPLSYLWPLTKKINSVHSGTLEITWLNGKKVLDSKNANYSYGSLERVLDYGLSHIKANRKKEVLVLGLGGGSVLGLLRSKFNYSANITAIEIDSKIIDVAIQEFGIRQYEPLELLCEDAFTYVQNAPARYGLIIVDIFIDLDVPMQFYSIYFWNQLSRLLCEGGEVLFNAGIYTANSREILELQERATYLNFRMLENVHGTNTLLLGVKTAEN